MARRFTEPRLVLASHNPGKLAELEALLAPHGVAVTSSRELGLAEPEETGRSFADNARLKALKAREEALMQKIDDFNKRQADASTRVDKLGELEDKWRAECGNRPYDERDEEAIKKEMAAKKAAGQ